MQRLELDLAVNLVDSEEAGGLLYGALANNQVLTGSRDSSVRVWAPAPSTDGFSYACTSTLLGHSHYVGTQTATPLDGLASRSSATIWLSASFTLRIMSRVSALSPHVGATSELAPEMTHASLVPLP